jgi:hypothetical protein
MLVVPTVEAQGKKPDNPGGGHGGGGEVAVNNLSHPAVDVGASGPSNAYFTLLNPGGLGVTYSYGCAKPDTTSVEGRTFDNTSCVSSDGNTFYSAAACTATGAPCEGYAVDRIYWQKNAANDWTADVVPGAGLLQASRVDWGDNLESKSWTANSVIRVETTPFVSVNPQLKGLAMWHVFGQGTNELWGVRATENELPYVYLSEFAIVKTTAILNIAKMTRGPSALCPTTNEPPPFGDQSWNSTDQAWIGSWVLHQVPFQPELNIGGRYVYGFNWNLRKDAVPPDVGKGGWWRLTFHVPNGISFSDSPGGVGGEYFTAPQPPAGAPEVLAAAARLLAAEEGDTGPLYWPKTYNVGNVSLTYMDVCVNETKGGGKAGGKGQGKNK